MATILQWSRLAQIGLIGFLSLLFVGVGYGVIVQQQVKQYHRLAAEEGVLKRNFELKQHLASTIDTYSNQIAIMDKRWVHVLQQLPTQNEMPGILDDISKTGLSSGLTFELFAPKTEVQHDFYIELPIQMTLLGQYHQLAVFLSRVAQMNRIVTWHDLVLERQSVEKPLYQAGAPLKMQMIAKIYRYRTT